MFCLGKHLKPRLLPVMSKLLIGGRASGGQRSQPVAHLAGAKGTEVLRHRALTYGRVPV